MKKLIILVTVLAISLLLFGCGGYNNDKKDIDTSVYIISTETLGDYVMSASVSTPAGKPKEKTILLSAILDENGNYINLESGDFTVTSAGKSPKFTAKPLSEANSKADIAFAIDSTGSMDYMIDGVKESISGFVTDLTSKGIDTKLAGVVFWDAVGYDIQYGTPIAIEDAIFNIDLTKNTTDFSDWLGTLNASGGGDNEEVSVDAIYELATKVKWRDGSRKIIIGITDVKSHQRDCVCGKDFALWTLDETVNKCKGKISVYTFSPDGSTLKSMRDNNGNMISNQKKAVSSHVDISEIANQTGGKAFYWDGGNLDLSTINLAQTIANGYEIKFTDVTTGKHFIDVKVTTKDGKNATLKIEISN